jgi:hypothetical protein
MTEDVVIAATRTDLDDIVYSAMTELASTMTGLSVREKAKFAIAAADRVMEGIDNLAGKSERSERAKRAAETRYSKPKPTPGPKIPPVAQDATARQQPQAAPAPGAMPTFTQMPPPSEPLAPPPHPALAPGATPFGAPPA